ncbi:MAG TPA: hypothetical protein VJH91_00200 [Candidatus Paceibacterota bacterium]
MSWASRRRTTYATSVTLFFILIIGGPLAYWYFSIPATCSDGKRNQGETAADKGGPCVLLDARSLSPSAILWARSFRIRDGSYNSVAYIQNPNEQAGVRAVRYRFGLYDGMNVLVAERIGTTYIMPAAVTPVHEGGIETGNRIVSRTYFELLDQPVWERMEDAARTIAVSDIRTSDITSEPRISAAIRNKDVRELKNLKFIVSVFDSAGNAFAASQTALAELGAGEETRIVFTWPDPFRMTPSRIDIIPLAPPLSAAP